MPWWQIAKLIEELLSFQHLLSAELQEKIQQLILEKAERETKEEENQSEKEAVNLESNKNSVQELVLVSGVSGLITASALIIIFQKTILSFRKLLVKQLKRKLFNKFSI